MTTNSEQPNALTRGQLRKLHASLTGALETITQNTTAEVATTLVQENVTTQTYLCIVVVKSDPGFDTKLAMRPFLDYLNTDKALELTVGELGFTTALTTNAKIWVNRNQTTKVDSFEACCLEQKPNELVQIYVNKNAMKLIGYDSGSWVYQPMSRLLFCYQVQLEPTEYIMTNTSVVMVNVTDPMMSISDYYPVTPSGIRVCIDTYVEKAKKTGSKSSGACSVPVVVGSYRIRGICMNWTIKMKLLRIEFDITEMNDLKPDVRNIDLIVDFFYFLHASVYRCPTLKESYQRPLFKQIKM